MGTITKSHAGELTVNFNKAQFVGADEEIFKYGIASFAYLIPRGKTIYLTDFSDLITRHYSGDPRVEYVKQIIEKAKITKKYLCDYSFFDAAGNLVNQTAKVDAENWHQVEGLIEQHLGKEIRGLEVKAGNYSYKRGLLHYKAYRADVVVNQH